MKKATVSVIVILLLLFVSPCLPAYDFGLVLNQDAGFSGIGDDTATEYSAALVPRFSVLWGDSAELYVSAGATVSYENEKWTFLPKLLRTELAWRTGDFKIMAGRMPYADPLDFVAEGLFDGAQVLYNAGFGTFSAGAWYTGLLDKKDSKIIMTAEDAEAYYADVVYDDLFNTCFASRRVVMAVGWEHPGLADVVSVKLALTGQFDVNDTDNPYHSQYASAKAALLLDPFIFELGGCTQFSMAPESDNDKFGVSFAGEMGAAWTPPLPFQSQLSLSGLFTSGNVGDGIISAFVPITAKEQGSVLNAHISGLSLVSLDYIARLHQTFSAGLCASLFMRSDLGTYRGYPVEVIDDKDHFLGTELFAQMIWGPVSDLQVNLGGGVFVPSNADADPEWRIEVSLVMAFF